jgi:hypothetical protein
MDSYRLNFPVILRCESIGTSTPSAFANEPRLPPSSRDD